MGTRQLGLLVMLALSIYGSSSESLLRQKRNWIIDSFTIDEGYEGPFPYSMGKVKVDKDLSIFKIEGQGVELEPRNVFQIDEDTGEITVHRPVDYEKWQTLILTFQAIDRDKHVVDTQLGIHVKIKDANDCAPEFDRMEYYSSVKPSTKQGTDLITIKAKDRDLTQEYKQFHFRIASVIPEPQDLEFYLIQTFPNDFADISFKGCLAHERVKRYTIIVEAKDTGEPKQLSSSCTVIINIEDKNSFLPVIMSQTGQAKVKEGEKNVLILRIPVRDEDPPGTAAWKAEYKIKGDTNNHFNITTDEKTNDGLLFVSKPLDYEDTPLTNITITVENEAPFFPCKVKERTTTGLWKITPSGETGAGVTGAESTIKLSSQRVNVIVEDVNEAPIFDIPNKGVRVMENVGVGKYLTTFTATDPDLRSSNTIRYKKGKDAAGWIAVDSKTGKVTTSNILDLESSFVNNTVYTVTLHAVDDGKPPMTGTATLSILIDDENDNAPFLVTRTLDVCQSNGDSMTKITASDLDKDPHNGGPFNFKLLGDVKDKWRIQPANGYSVDLVKDSRVHSGLYDLMVEVADLQGLAAVHNLSVTVCNCKDPTKPNCRMRKSALSSAGGASIGIILLSLLLIAGLLLLVFLFSCKKDKIPLADDGSGHLMISNTETRGNDCEVAYGSSPTSKQIQAASQAQTATARQAYKSGVTSTATENETLVKHHQLKSQQTLINDSVFEDYSHSRRGMSSFSRQNSLPMGMAAFSSMRRTQQWRRSSYGEWGTGNLQYQKNLLNKKLQALEASSRELGDYEPHVYAEEGKSQHNFRLDAISIPEVPFDPDMDLDYKFHNLASVCMPNNDFVYSTET